jgi:hypothetical protein
VAVTTPPWHGIALDQHAEDQAPEPTSLRKEQKLEMMGVLAGFIATI